MQAKYRNEISYNEYKLDELKSGLQKYIRRNILDKALYCAGEFDLFKECEGGERIRTNMIHRLMIIFMEDIGVASLELWKYIDELIFLLIDERKKKNRNKLFEEQFVYDIVLQMCKAKKSRNCSHVRSFAEINKDTVKLANCHPRIKEIYEELFSDSLCANIDKLDKLTLSQLNALLKKSMLDKKWTSAIFAFKVKQLSDDKCVLSVIFDTFNASSYMNEYESLTKRWLKELKNTKESFLVWLLPLCAYIQNIKTYNKLKKQTSLPVLYNDGWKINREKNKIELDDFIYDIHTHKKTKIDKKFTTFALTGAFVENESEYVIQDFKKFYEDVKKHKDANSNKNSQHPLKCNEVSLEQSDSKESVLFEFVVRAQVNTSKTKQDVYFANDLKSRNFVVVKGPYIDRKNIDNMIKIAEWKRENNIPFINYYIKELIPDREINCPLGIRNKVDTNKPHYFVIFDSLISKNDIHTKVHNTKLWKNEVVVDFDKYDIHLKFDELTKEQVKDYVCALLFRWLFGLSDLADRNFLVKDRVYSIDEEQYDKDVNFRNELRKNRCDKIIDYLEKAYTELNLHKWKIPEKYESKSLQILDKDNCINLFK